MTMDGNQSNPGHTNGASTAVHSRVAQMISQQPAAEEGSAEETQAEVKAGEVPAAKVTVDPVAPDPAAQQAAAELELKRAEMADKLAQARARNEARRIREQSRAQARQAEQDRQAAAQERAKWEALKAGNFKKGIEALGLDPHETFKEMQREAIEAGTPEASIRQMRADFERQMQERLAPLEDLKREIAQLKQEKARADHMMREQRLENAFTRQLQDTKYSELRAEYDDGQILGYVRHLDQNPALFYATAKKHNIRLTAPEKGYTMSEILDVLAAEQVAHERGKQQRRERLQATATPGSRSEPSKAPTVNGTVVQSNAGTTVSNDLAAETATKGGKKLSRAERIQREIERLDRR